MRRLLALSLTFFVAACPSFAAETAPDLRVSKDIVYRTGSDLTAYEAERCKLDVTLPAKSDQPFATYVWFYGGGLKNGSKALASEYCAEIAASFAREGIAVVVPDYRLSPQAKYPEYVDDAAAAFAWTVRNIGRMGGDPRKVFIGGHSAGGYLALMVGFDASRLKPYGLDLKDIAGIAQVSGQVFTHYTIREERGQSRYRVTSDEAAPAFHVQKTLPPILTLYSDHDMTGRAEENQFLIAMLKGAGHVETYSLKVTDTDHGSIGHNLRFNADPGHKAVLQFIRKQGESR
jgi:acetyl esterase/lipase